MSVFTFSFLAYTRFFIFDELARKQALGIILRKTSMAILATKKNFRLKVELHYPDTEFIALGFFSKRIKSPNNIVKILILSHLI
jgi:hypothetical protein